MSQEMTVKSLQALIGNATFSNHIKMNLAMFPMIMHVHTNGNHLDGLATTLNQAHESVSAFAQAYSLCEKESAAAVNLRQDIPQPIKEALTELVRTLGITKSYCCLNIIKSGLFDSQRRL